MVIYTYFCYHELSLEVSVNERNSNISVFESEQNDKTRKPYVQPSYFKKCCALRLTFMDIRIDKVVVDI